MTILIFANFWKLVEKYRNERKLIKRRRQRLGFRDGLIISFPNLESDHVDLIFTVQTDNWIGNIIFSAAKRAAAKVAFGAIFHFQTFRLVECLSSVEFPALAELLVDLREARGPRQTRPGQTFFELDWAKIAIFIAQMREIMNGASICAEADCCLSWHLVHFSAASSRRENRRATENDSIADF